MGQAQIICCDRFWSRFIGSARSGLVPGDVLVFPGVVAVHTLFGRLPMRIEFLSSTGTVVKTISRPRRFWMYRCAGAAGVRELL